MNRIEKLLNLKGGNFKNYLINLSSKIKLSDFTKEELQVLFLFLSSPKMDERKDILWSLAPHIDAKNIFLKFCEQMFKKIDKIKDEDLEYFGIFGAFKYYLNNTKKEKYKIIDDINHLSNVRLREYIGNYLFKKNKIDGTKQWAKLYATSAEPYHPYSSFEMDLYYDGTQDLLNEIIGEQKNLDLENSEQRKLYDVYSYFLKIINDGLHQRNE